MPKATSMADNRRRNGGRARYTPTEEDIRRKCREIQDGWSDEERWVRAHPGSHVQDYPGRTSTVDYGTPQRLGTLFGCRR